MADAHDPNADWMRKPDGLTNARWEIEIARQAAYKQGVEAFSGDPEADRTAFNPYDGDTEPLLYDAWERGNDDAANGMRQL